MVKGVPLSRNLVEKKFFQNDLSDVHIINKMEGNNLQKLKSLYQST